MRRLLTLASLLALVALPLPARGQGGEARGRVVDASTGQGVADATVRIEGSSLARTVVVVR